MIKAVTENEITTVYVYGKIDSSNAGEFESKLLSSLAGCDTAVLDLNELSYITSAGLRVLLKAKKAVKTLSIINVSMEVYEIFEMTGFSEIIEIHRKRRQLSAEGCSELARGAMGIIYRLDPDTLLKVYDSSISLKSLYRSQDILKQLFTHDIPCAIPFDIVDVGETHGAVYEMLDMDTMAQYINKHPEEVEECGRKAALLLKSLHQGELPDGMLPNIKEIVPEWLEDLKEYLTPEDTARYEEIFAGLKDTKNFLHLDFHPKNIMTNGTELMIIDLDDACVGDPIMDIACLLMTIGREDWDDAESRKFCGISLKDRDAYARSFFRAYFETEDDEEISRILAPLRSIQALRMLYARAHRVGLAPEVKQALLDDAIAFLKKSLYQ